MKLDRNTNPDGRGKYALINMRELTRVELAGSHAEKEAVASALLVLQQRGLVTFGNESLEQQFFVIKYKDVFAAAALRAYAIAATQNGQQEWAEEIFNEARIASEVTSSRIPD